MRHSVRGFTLLEMLLSIAALGVIVSIGIPVFQSFQVRNDLDIAATTVASSLRRAQVLSVASDGDSSWGLHVSTSTIVVFKGNSFAARDTTFDETFELPVSVVATGVTDIVFAKLSGAPTSVGTTTLTSVTQEVKTVHINAKGTITY